jgi:signal transduction histidine kinase
MDNEQEIDLTYHEHGHIIVLNDLITDASDDVIHTLTFYPSSLDQFRTRSPIAVSMGFILIILMSTSFFFLYDYLMRRQSNEQQVVLDLKGRFVRFISHEIRTPLNTVCMGLEILESDMQAHHRKASQEEANAKLDGIPEESELTAWHNRECIQRCGHLE